MQPVQKTAVQLVADARHRIENLSPNQVVDELGRGGVLLVDVREAERAEMRAIPGSIHAARGMLEFYADPTSRTIGPSSIRTVARSCTALGAPAPRSPSKPRSSWATAISRISKVALLLGREPVEG
jgi:hypothetical protein